MQSSFLNVNNNNQKMQELGGNGKWKRNSIAEPKKLTESWVSKCLKPFQLIKS